MKPANKRRLLFAVLLVMIALGVVWFAPARIEGCYLEAGDEFNATAGYSFTYFHEGGVYSCNEYRSNATFLGRYRQEPDVGWVWTLRGSGRRVQVKPRLLYVRFEAIDNVPRLATAPFQWRDPRSGKTRQVLQTTRLSSDANVIGR